MGQPGVLPDFAEEILYVDELKRATPKRWEVKIQPR